MKGSGMGPIGSATRGNPGTWIAKIGIRLSRSAAVPKKFYPRATNAGDVKTFAVKATFVTSAKVPDNVVYTVTKEVFAKIESYRTLHPAFDGLTRDKMLECLAAPIHPGAMKYYDEVGLVPACVVK